MTLKPRWKHESGTVLNSGLPFVLVTGNHNKLLEAERILGRRPNCQPIDLPEIQSLDLITVLRAKGQEAWERLQCPLVVEETGLELKALNGFPGPLVKWMLEAVGPSGIARAAHGLQEPQATARCGLLYRDSETTIIVEGETSGHLLLEPRGDQGFGWDPIFVPHGHQETYAELSPEEKDRFGHRGRAWQNLLQDLVDADIITLVEH